ncbi:hypothetical protein RD792_006147 [Penstemon davidsonii]|uniref:RING-type E3 ubiquitin transferase n=1 Tax=Penstemon davidsonii TaxID=160366 RepID=A0ABR0DDB8_9LAMI|nr:hypothetical protein RD792_006147 [Penstemon davidsonii]
MSSHVCTHWCFSCSRPILAEPPYLACPYCHGGFIQPIYEFLNSQPPHAFSHDPRIGIVDNSLATRLWQRLTGPGPSYDRQLPPGEIVRGPPGSFNHYPGPGPGPGPPDFDDYYEEQHQLDEQILEQQLQSTPVSPGYNSSSTPAPRSAIDSLPTVRITQRHLRTDANCVVCLNDFKLGTQAKRMPCDHIYHSNCIVNWLLQHNTCPVCRFVFGSGSVNQRTGNSSSSSS